MTISKEWEDKPRLGKKSEKTHLMDNYPKYTKNS